MKLTSKQTSHKIIANYYAGSFFVLGEISYVISIVNKIPYILIRYL